MKLLVAALAFFAGAACAQPVLNFAPPQGFTGSLGRDPAAHVSKEGDAIVNVYPFKPLGGALGDKFRATLLKELIQEDRQERKLAGAPEIAPIAVPGADEALFAKFVEDRSGALRYRLRVAIRSGDSVAIVDYDASGPKAYMGHWPVVSTSLDSMKVSKARAAPASKTKGAAAGGGAQGLYLTTTRRFMPTFGGAPGSGTFQMATRFYLLSGDGRFHRGYDLPSVPGGDIRTFDYAKAQREDAHNTGTYTMQGDRIAFRSSTGDTTEGTVAGSEMTVENMTFKKAALKQ